MSYYVEYNPELRKRYPAAKKTRKKRLQIFVVLLAIIAMIYTITGGGLLRYMIPGDPDITIGAMRSIVEQVDEGVAVRDAFAGFCREIIGNVS